MKSTHQIIPPPPFPLQFVYDHKQPNFIDKQKGQSASQDEEEREREAEETFKTTYKNKEK